MIAYRFVSLPDNPEIGAVVPSNGPARPAMFLLPEQAKPDDEPHETTMMTVAKIQAEVAEYYGLALEHMRSRSRDRDHVYPRFMAMLLSRELTQLSLPSIATRFGKKDHTTVIHGIQVAKRLIREDETVEHEYRTLRKRLAA